MPRIVEERIAGGDFDDGAEIHDRNRRADEFHDTQVVADEQVGQPQVALEVGEQIEDLRLDRDVECRDRLIRNQYRRIERQCARDAEALYRLAAREFVRKAIPTDVRASPTESNRKRFDPAPERRVIGPAVIDQGLGDKIWRAVMRGLSEANGS